MPVTDRKIILPGGLIKERIVGLCVLCFYCINTSYPMDTNGQHRLALQMTEKVILRKHWQVGPVLCIRQVVHGTSFLSRQRYVIVSFWHVYCAGMLVYYLLHFFNVSTQHGITRTHPGC